MQTDFFKLPNDTIKAMYSSLDSGDNLKDRVSALLMPLLVVFSAAIYGGKVSNKTWILTGFFLLLITISEYLIIQLRSEELISSLQYSEIKASIFLKYFIDVQDSLITFFGVVLGLSGVNTIQNKMREKERTNSPSNINGGKNE